jgi:hypothetical protein
MAVRDMTPDVGAQIEDSTPIIRALLHKPSQPSRGWWMLPPRGGPVSKDRGGRPRLSE